MSDQPRKYQPRRLSERHYAILRAVHTGAKKQEVAKRFGISESQIGRITNSDLGRAYLREMRERATQITVEAWASMIVYDVVAAKKPHLLNLR